MNDDVCKELTVYMQCCQIIDFLLINRTIAASLVCKYRIFTHRKPSVLGQNSWAIGQGGWVVGGEGRGGLGSNTHF